ncbi:hypothetical protein NEPAR06_1038 [Nematocida parisii]|uniref:SUI1 domain-containing protein n=1 Tax=Nematocida parisii (strain ERTm3) TaxID=935791 RepID=I3EFL6_NEMP3|nr:uncharacterized protein NEPG_01493 [Nematocida parisii ERTm1]EIJ88013.1 hypothetical protein NEQG_01457 [Nematocida parisii ERTm3]KAI5128412.1 hypothetical protein NEPAR08_1223 [Nematocida parisii]EIJ93921.1 hypothetical protein NEPG_01493 [Nematocida parisii ERTm1]KAI5128501.1 hypothetical protein NEPAR03_1355 [Nematocida parisii]KAI5143436.1 hypothetical protein NEPAR04_1827 [Nematocida parisii]|eukprot:XP_013059321.1 hypothetical protein NEPG_01493 [Nematocida parisii ERTm1]
MLEDQLYCDKCGFPPEYCEYSAVCMGTKKEAPLKPDAKIVVTTKRVSGNKRVTLVKNLHLLMNSTKMKELAKKCSKTIACGSTLIKNGSGTEDISVQTSEDYKVIEILVKSGVPSNRIDRIVK